MAFSSLNCTCYVCSSVSEDKDVVCCCLCCSVLTHQYLLTRLLSALLPDCVSGAKLQSSLDLGGQSGVGRHARPSLAFSNTSCSVASFLLLLANMPGNVIHKVELLSIFIPFLLNHHFVFLFFFSV